MAFATGAYLATQGEDEWAEAVEVGGAGGGRGGREDREINGKTGATCCVLSQSKRMCPRRFSGLCYRVRK